MAGELSPPIDTVFELRGRLHARCRKRAGGRTELLGVLVVLGASVCAAVWISQSVNIDAAGLAAAPGALGVTPWSGSAAHKRPGFPAPLLLENRATPVTRGDHPG